MAGMEHSILRELRASGCQIVRHGKGSHTIWENPSGFRFAVPFRIENKGTASHILKQSGTSCPRVK